VFESNFSREITSFLELRKSNVSPDTFRNDKATLASLDRYLVECDYHEKNLSEEITIAWIQTLSGKSKTVKNKVIAARSFVKYINVMGRHSFLPDVPKVKSDFIPYIFSDDDLSLLIHHADNLEVEKPWHCNPYLWAMIPMILRILYGCGTRIGETMALKRTDIDFKARTIFLRETKYSKERLIPVHDTLISIMEKYCLALGIMLSPDAYLFPGRKPGSHFVQREVQYWFAKLLGMAGIDQGKKKPNERGASLHCYRHVFVLKSMQQIEAAGHPVNMNDLLLPTYLGHECLLDTDRYMRFSGAQVPESLAAFEAFSADIIPKVEVSYEDE
jgi:integrase